MTCKKQVINVTTTYISLFLLEILIFKMVEKIIRVTNISNIVKGIDSKVIKNSFGVLRAIHILFINSIFFNNLQKFIFKFRTNIAITIIIEIHS